ncbi:MAG: hypothetical protein HDT21_05335 [Ruminococcus sp.]|nr:hypothetical protein [Ruminococcus sp.]
MICMRAAFRYRAILLVCNVVQRGRVSPRLPCSGKSAVSLYADFLRRIQLMVSSAVLFA